MLSVAAVGQRPQHGHGVDETLSEGRVSIGEGRRRRERMGLLPGAISILWMLLSLFCVQRLEGVCEWLEVKNGKGVRL